MESFKALGLSYKNTPIEIREKIAFNNEQAGQFLIRLKEIFNVEEAMLVSTCNRTELYYTLSSNKALDIIACIASFKGINSKELQNYFKHYNVLEATNHLFCVTLGLESHVLGDIQISNQIKQAYQQSADIGLAGPHLHRLMHTIFYTNKRVVQETELQDGTASVASVAVSLIERFIGNIENPRIALIGLGEIGQNILENLKDEVCTITLLNRTKSKIDKFAVKKNIKASDFSKLHEVVNENDVIICAINTPTPILSIQNFNSDSIHKLLVDLSVPRSIDSNLDSFPGISLYNVDQLTVKTTKAKIAREKAIPNVKKIISQELRNFIEWKNEIGVSPTIQRLKSTLEQIRKEELARHKKLNASEIELLDIVTKNIIQKVIKLPVLQLKAACKRGEVETLVEVLNDLFNLEPTKV